MLKMINTNRTYLYVGAALVSMLFSILAVYNDPLVNEDGIVYLLAAEIYVNKGTAAATAFYKWPFYAMAIGTVQQVFGCTFLFAARFVNALLLAGLVVSFITLTRASSGTQATGIFAAVLILLSPPLNEFRAYVIRDFGYWWFCLLSFIALIRFLQSERLRFALAWALTTGVAALFRPEAMLLLAVMPLAALQLRSHTWPQRLTAAARLYAFTFMVLAVGAIMYTLAPGDSAVAAPAIAFSEYMARADLFVERLLTLRERYIEYVLHPYSADYAPIVLTMGLITILFFKLIKIVHPVYAALLVTGLAKRLMRLAPESAAVLRTALIITIVTLFVFLLDRQFLQTRYAMLAALILMVYCAIALDSFVNGVGGPAVGAGMRKVLVVLGVLLLGDSFVSTGPSHQYLLDAATWVKENTPPDATVFSNDNKIAYYSGRKFDWHTNERAMELISSGKVPKNTDYWVMYLRGADDELRRRLAKPSRHLTEIRSFSGARGNQVIVLRETASE